MPTVMKNKTISRKQGSTVPGAGPSGKMMKQQHTGAQKPGVTSQEKGASGGKFAKGGSTKMFGKQTVKAVKPA